MHADISSSLKVGCRIKCGRDICKGDLLRLFFCEASNARGNMFSSRLKETRTRKDIPFNITHVLVVTAVRTQPRYLGHISASTLSASFSKPYGSNRCLRVHNPDKAEATFAALYYENLRKS